MSWVEILERLKEAGGLTDKELAALERRNKRRISRCVELVAVRPNGEQVDVVGTNFGTGGLRVESLQRLRPQELLKLRLAALRQDGEWLRYDEIPVRVQWCKRNKRRSLFESGMQFVGSTQEESMVTARFLLDDCKVGLNNPREQRKAPRTVTQITATATAGGQPQSVKVLDLAAGGAQLLSNDAIERGSNLAVKIILSQNEPPLDYEGTVVRCSHNEALEGYELGVYFVNVHEDNRNRLVEFLSRSLR